jgi:hypothetical protein
VGRDQCPHQQIVAVARLPAGERRGIRDADTNAEHTVADLVTGDFHLAGERVLRPHRQERSGGIDKALGEEVKAALNGIR